MKPIVQTLVTDNRSLEDGTPDGGSAVCLVPSGDVQLEVLRLRWQQGALVDPDTKQERPANGVFLATVARVVVDRLEYYQSTKFACAENAEALEHFRKGLALLEKRANRRSGEGTLGTHEPDKKAPKS